MEAQEGDVHDPWRWGLRMEAVVGLVSGIRELWMEVLPLVQDPDARHERDGVGVPQRDTAHGGATQFRQHRAARDRYTQRWTEAATFHERVAVECARIVLPVAG